MKKCAIFCYFDESVQFDKYGLINPADHYREIKALLKLVIEDPTVGLIIKMQFQSNLPQYNDAISDIRNEAITTRRCIKLSNGAHRNIVFPAEAALAADIVIGHTVGASAGLETALAGPMNLAKHSMTFRYSAKVLGLRSFVLTLSSW